MVDTKEEQPRHPLTGLVHATKYKKKELTHVENIKNTGDMMSEVRKDAATKKETLNHVKPIAKQELLSEVRTDSAAKKESLNQVQPAAKQELLSAVRSDTPNTKKGLVHVEPKDISGLMTEVRQQKD